ncbi:hypothetical protein AAVH_19562 [Aphelenchoides avenae]|nr:hypothetical protein AAVH_37168 [Aphelenchus avenae]KAH7713080.1 hypothetical protein AAVH_19562 [Aphelenchus avenae]
MILIILVLCLSCIRHKAKVNVDPRIFTVNMMLFDAIHAVVSFLTDFQSTNKGFENMLYNFGIYRIVTTHADSVRSLAMLVFNCSLIPMMGMSIVACLSTQRISQRSSVLTFAALIGISDLIPILIQVVNDVTRPSGFWTWGTLLYVLATFLLYSVQIALTITAAVVLYLKSTKNAQPVVNGGMNKNLVRVICFAAGPCALQVPFALFLIVQQLANAPHAYELLNQKCRLTAVFSVPFGVCFAIGIHYVGARPDSIMGLSYKMGHILRLVLSVKPTVDAVFTLLFMGEYRQYTINFYKWLREKLTGHKSGQSTTRVTEFQRNPALTRTATARTLSGQSNNTNGAGPSAMTRSTSLPVHIKTISTS